MRSFGQAVDLLASGAVDPRPLFGEPLPLERWGEAVDRVRAPARMLVNQGVTSIRHWTGTDPDPAVMRATLEGLFSS